MPGIFQGVVGGAVVDQENFQIGIGLLHHAGNNVVDIPLGVIQGNDDADELVFHMQHRS